VAKTAQSWNGFDGDADRIGLLDHSGRFILGDEINALISQSVLMDNPGAKLSPM